MALTVLDANVLMAAANVEDDLHGRASAALREALRGPVVMPASAYAESLVDPMRAGRADAIEDFVDSAPIEIVSIDRRIARRAAALRAERPTLRLPDALVLATGDVLDADEVLTGDRRLSSASDRVRAL